MAEVKGQDVSVIVGEGGLTGKALIAGRARRMAATRVVVGLYGLFAVAVSIKGILPLWAREGSQRSGPSTSSLLTLDFPYRPALGGEGLPATGAEREGQRASGQGGRCGCTVLGRWENPRTDGAWSRGHARRAGMVDEGLRRGQSQADGWPTGACVEPRADETRSAEWRLRTNRLRRRIQWVDGQLQADEQVDALAAGRHMD